MKIWFNGKLVPKAEAQVSVFDHGLLYGDGVFEGIRSYNRLVFKLKEHIDRLYESAHSIMLDIGMSKKAMMNAVVETLKENNLNDGYIRLVVTRGEGDLGLDPRKCFGKPTVFIIADKIVLYPEKLYEKGLEIITVPTVRNHPEALNPRIKSLNYLNNILAKIEAGNKGYDEAIMFDHLGYVAECTGDNIFLVKDNALYTPAYYMGSILKGITRDMVLELAKKDNIKTFENIVTRHELYVADEVFLTGTAAEIVPVIKIDSRKIGEGRPGPITIKLIEQFRLVTKTDGVKY